MKETGRTLRNLLYDRVVDDAALLGELASVGGVEVAEGGVGGDNDALRLEPLDVLRLLEVRVDLELDGWRTRKESGWPLVNRAQRLNSPSGMCLAVLRTSSTSDWIMLERPMLRTLPVLRRSSIAAQVWPSVTVRSTRGVPSSFLGMSSSPACMGAGPGDKMYE